MPVLPIDHPEPFAAILGVMLYPGADEAEIRKARAFAAQYLAEPLKRFHVAGYQLSHSALLRIATETGERLTDLDERWWGGTATGELVKAFFALSASRPKLASWNNAIKIFELASARPRASGARTALWEAKRRFVSVAHLWGAWSIREGKFATQLDHGYEDFQAFLTEAEILRDWGQKWQQPYSKRKPPLPSDVWRMPEKWAGVPGLTFSIPELPEEFLAELRPAGRPRSCP